MLSEAKVSELESTASESGTNVDLKVDNSDIKLQNAVQKPLVMVAILTSSNLDYLIRAINSVKSQVIGNKPFPFDYDVWIIINSLNKDYYDEVNRYFHTESVLAQYPFMIRIASSTSNGYPGKGHNSVLATFERHAHYNYCFMLDGDDLYYPSAFQQFSKLFGKGYDVAYLIINDKISNTKELLPHIKLNDRFYLYTTTYESNIWKHSLQPKNPWETNFYTCKTPARILFMSREIFKKDKLIEYCEDSYLYDDYMPFLQVFDHGRCGRLSTAYITNSWIYLYNSMNDNSSTLDFSTKSSNDKDVFMQKSEEFRSKYSYKWNEVFENAPYVPLGMPENFSIKDKCQFAMKNLVLNEIESINKQYNWALSQNNYHMAKCFNDRLKNFSFGENMFTVLERSIVLNHKLNNTDELIKDMEEIIILCNKTIPALGKMIDEGEIDALKKASLKHYAEILSSLRQNMKQKFIITVASKRLWDLSLIKNARAYATECKGLPDKVIERIDSQFKKLVPKRLSVCEKRKTICFYMGYTPMFNASTMLLTPGIFGSEIAVISVASILKEDNDVYIIANVPKRQKFNGISYIPINEMRKFLDIFHINVMVISRFLHGFLEANINADKVVFWVHDARPNEFWHGKRLPEFGVRTFRNVIKRIDKIVCVSEWQRRLIKMTSGISSSDMNKFNIIGNGINLRYFSPPGKAPKKKKGRFIFCSDPSRGLDPLLNLFPFIKRKMPYATLDIYFDKDKLTKTQMSLIRTQSGVTFHGRVSHHQIVREMEKSEYFLYPLIGHETFCINALDAMAAGCVCISRDYSGIAEILNNRRGIMIGGNPQTITWQRRAVSAVMNVEKNLQVKQNLIKGGQEWAIKQHWEAKVDQWKEMLSL
jgi:glycosyltransferase involved in cell wall biosynthesis